MSTFPLSFGRVPVRSRARGSVLIVAFWIVIALAALVLVFARSMRTELAIAANSASDAVADAAERGAEAYLLSLVDEQADAVLDLAETWFAELEIGEALVWFLRPTWGDASVPVYGLVDESAKLNVNNASASTLEKLPGWVPEIAAAVVDWRDSDSDPSTNGVEDSYYLSLPDPYRAKNADFESLEELLLVRGVTRALLDGNLAALAAGGAQGSPGGAGAGMGALGAPAGGVALLGSGSSLVTDTTLARGTRDLLTVWSREGSAASTDTTGSTGGSTSGATGGSQGGAGGAGGGGGGGGGGQVNVNDDNREALRSLLQQTFGEERASEIAERTRPMPPFRDVFDFAARGQLEQEELDQIYSKLTTGSRASDRGRINVLTAPREVLVCLPNVSQGDVDNLIARRKGITDRTSPSWIYSALEQKGVGLADLITTRAYQFSTEIIAVSADGRAFRRVRIVIDARQSPARIVFRRDLTDQGWPLPESFRENLRLGALSGTGGRV